jgi:hypothetical protein
VRILAQTDHSILPKAITDSCASRSVILAQADHRFLRHADQKPGAAGTVIGMTGIAL